MNSNPPLIYAHRGGAGLWPELTLHAYKNALALGVDSIDLDVHLSRDKVVVVTHDPVISKSLARKYARFLQEDGPAILDLTLDEIKNYDVGMLNPDSEYKKNYPQQISLDGETIPTLEQVLLLCEVQSNHEMHYQIEIKNAPGTQKEGALSHEIVPRVIEILKKFKVGKRTQIHAFMWENVLLAKSLLPDISTAFLTESQVAIDQDQAYSKSWCAGHSFHKLADVPAILKEMRADIWNPEGNTLDLSLIEIAHSHGIKVIPWTVDDSARMKALIDAGIDGIITNRPDRMRDLFTNLKYSTPKPWPILL